MTKAKQAKQPKRWTFKQKQPWGDVVEYEVGFDVRTMDGSASWNNGYYTATVTLRIGEVADTYAYNHWKELASVRWQANHGEETQAPQEPAHALPVYFEREDVKRDRHVYVKWYGGTIETVGGNSDYGTWKQNVARFQMVWEKLLDYQKDKGLNYKWLNDAPGMTIDALLALGAQPLEYDRADYAYKPADNFQTWLFRD